MSAEYLATTAWPITETLDAIGPTRCHTRRCKSRRLEPGETIVCVSHKRRALNEPRSDRACAYLCGGCVNIMDHRGQLDWAAPIDATWEPPKLVFSAPPGPAW